MLIKAGENIWLGNVLLSPEPIIEVSCSKNIKETVVAGRVGTVKELICTNEAMVTIRGRILPDFTLTIGPAFLGLTNPVDDQINEKITVLRELFNKNERLVIECKMLNSLGVEHVVITELSFPERASSDWQDYVIRLVEDAEILEFEK